MTIILSAEISESIHSNNGQFRRSSELPSLQYNCQDCLGLESDNCYFGYVKLMEAKYSDTLGIRAWQILAWTAYGTVGYGDKSNLEMVEFLVCFGVVGEKKSQHFLDTVLEL